MGTTLYHFSGTGNSLKIARDLAAALEGAELIALARATGERAAPDADVVGMVFPVYAWGPPSVVRAFLDRLKPAPNAYVFAVCTCGGSASGTLVITKRRLASRGITLSAGFVVPMPTNYIVWGGALPEPKQKAMFEAAQARIDEIARVVRERRQQEVEKGSLISRLVTAPIYRLSSNAFAALDKKFVVGDSCNHCGLCAKVCQVDNIELQDGKPVWGHRCEQCLACLQWCPQEAIQVGTKTVGRQRYHHPEIKASDLMQEATPSNE